jgi:hypothetical protein
MLIGARDQKPVHTPLHKLFAKERDALDTLRRVGAHIEGLEHDHASQLLLIEV